MQKVAGASCYVMIVEGGWGYGGIALGMLCTTILYPYG
jgi:hypothetical protein